MTAKQVRNAIGDLAGSGVDISGACIVDPKKLNKLEQFDKFVTEWVTQDEEVMPEFIRSVPGGAAANQ